MTRLVVGSTALRALGVGNREPSDLDTFSDDPRPGEDAYWAPELAEWLPPGTDRYATLDELYTIKVSHSYWELPNKSWDKHLFDVVELKRAGAVLDLELHDFLYRIWERDHGKKWLNLYQDSDNFFGDAVRRVYDHDSLHVSVALGERPAYEAVLKDGEEVAMDMRKIKALPFAEQVQLFREEVYVTALERLIIPSGYEYPRRRAYTWALRRTITSLTKGWSARFLVENYDVFRDPGMNYVAHHLSKSDALIKLEEA